MATEQNLRPFIFGDSIGVGLIAEEGGKNGFIHFDELNNLNNIDGIAKSGDSPAKVLANIVKAIAKNPARFNGADITLSTGLSNNIQGLATIKDEIIALKNAGVAHIYMLGVGDRPDFEAAKCNTKLSDLAAEFQAKGVIFTGPLDPSLLMSDHVHLTAKGNRAVLNKIRALQHHQPSEAHPAPAAQQPPANSAPAAPAAPAAPPRQPKAKHTPVGAPTHEEARPTIHHTRAKAKAGAHPKAITYGGDGTADALMELEQEWIGGGDRGDPDAIIRATVGRLRNVPLGIRQSNPVKNIQDHVTRGHEKPMTAQDVAAAWAAKKIPQQSP